MTLPLPTCIPRLLSAGFLAALLGALPLPSAAQAVDPGQGMVKLSTGFTCAFNTTTTYKSGGVYVDCGGTPAGGATITLGTPSNPIDSAAGGGADLPVTCGGVCSNLVVGLTVQTANPGVIVTPSLTFTATGLQYAVVTGTPNLTPGVATIAVTVTSPGTATSTSVTPPSQNVSITSATGTLAITQNSPGSVPEGASPVTVTVTRTTGAGASAPATAVPFNCAILPAGYAPPIIPPNGSTLSWTAGDSAAKTFQITPTTVPGTGNGTITCTLGAATAGAAVDSTPYSLTVTKAATGVCGTATREADATTGAGSIFYAIIGNGESWALKFNPMWASFTQLQIQMTMPSPATARPAPTSYIVNSNISECKGDFTTNVGPNCGPWNTNRTSVVFNTSSYTDPTRCVLDPAKTYYFNVRYVRPDGTSSCTASSGCGAGVNLTYQ